jgi:hypothetical protein
MYEVDGRGYSGEVKVSKEHFDEVREGEAITVRAWDVMPDSGQWPRLPGHLPIEDLAGKWFFAAFWNGILSLFLWLFYVSPWRQRQLVSIGIPTQAIIRDVNVQMNKGTKNYVMLYEYAVPVTEDQPGRVLTGKLSSTAKAAASAKRGEVVTVLYDPRKPRRSLLYRYSSYRAA